MHQEAHQFCPAFRCILLHVHTLLSLFSKSEKKKKSIAKEPKIYLRSFPVKQQRLMQSSSTHNDIKPFLYVPLSVHYYHACAHFAFQLTFSLSFYLLLNMLSVILSFVSTTSAYYLLLDHPLIS